MDASGLWRAGIVRASITVIAIEGFRCNTCSLFTCGRYRTGIVIVTLGLIRREDTITAVTTLVGAWISVIAGNSFAALACSIDACVTDRTGVSIVTYSDDDDVGTPSIRKTAILGTGVTIIAG
tara:strand:+ start:784 stop:1152 length:369 start_codon:yes stop_codon:yes gene_type:complete